MAHKIVGFAYSDSNNLSYIKNQLDAIKNAFPNLETELANENDSRLLHLSPNHRKYLPTYMILKNDAYKTHRNGKYTYNQVVEWINSIHGINA